MKKTGYEIIGMIKDGKAPKKIKRMTDNKIYNWDEEFFHYKNGAICIDLLMNLNDEFEIIEDSKVWKPKAYDDFYCIEQDGNVQSIQCYSDKLTENYCELGNCFKTEAEAEKALEKIKIYTQLKRYAEEHNTENIGWNNKKQCKWAICYDYEEKLIFSNETYVIGDIGQIYFTSEELAEQAIQEIGKDNIKKLFED